VLPVRKIQQNKHVLLAENFLNHMEQKNELWPTFYMKTIWLLGFSFVLLWSFFYELEVTQTIKQARTKTFSLHCRERNSGSLVLESSFFNTRKVKLVLLLLRFGCLRL
jgi:hypothetical protein